MTKFRKTFAIGAAIVFSSGALLVSDLSFAQNNDGKQFQKGQSKGKHLGRNWNDERGQRGFMQRFAILDENSDDRIGADEAAAWRESVFAAMDADDDNELTLEEYMAVRMGTGEKRNAERQKLKQQQKQARFKPMDSDKSDKVSKVEWMTSGKAEFETADADKDGKVTPWEFRAHRTNY